MAALRDAERRLDAVNGERADDDLQPLDYGLGLHVVARQFNYRDPWEAQGRVNDVVDVALLKDGGYSTLPKGHDWFQDVDEETGVDAEGLKAIVAIVRGINPKVYALQKLTGDL